MEFPERPITIHLADSGESFEFDPDDKLWTDMRAFCEVTGLTIEELITRALEEFLPKVSRGTSQHSEKSSQT